MKSLLNLIDCQLDAFHDEAKINQMESRDILTWLEGVFFFAFTWSIGATTNEDGRKAFDKLTRELMNGGMMEETRIKLQLIETVPPPLQDYQGLYPHKGTIYDYRFIAEVGVPCRCMCLY